MSVPDVEGGWEAVDAEALRERELRDYVAACETFLARQDSLAKIAFWAVRQRLLPGKGKDDDPKTP